MMINSHRWLIHQILINEKAARNSDDELFALFIETTNPELARMPISKAFRCKDMPSYKSISRERRYWQRVDPLTWSDAKIQAMREQLEDEYRKRYSKKKR